MHYLSLDKWTEDQTAEATVRNGQKDTGDLGKGPGNHQVYERTPVVNKIAEFCAQQKRS